MHLVAGDAAADRAEDGVVVGVMPGDRAGGGAGKATDRLRRSRRKSGNGGKAKRERASRKNMISSHMHPPDQAQSAFGPNARRRRAVGM